MKLGISTATFFGKYRTEEVFALLRQMHIGKAEVFFTTFSEYTTEFAQLLKLRQAEYGIEVPSVHTLNTQFEPELFNPMPRTYQDARRIFENVLRSAQTLQAHTSVFHGSARLKRRPYVFDYDFLSQRLNALTDFTRQYGVQLAYENVHWTYYSEPEYFLALKPRCPQLKMVLDIKQAMQSKISYREFLKAGEGRLVNVHLCDYLSDGTLTIPGKGVFDFVTFFSVLRDGGYDGNCMLELYSRNWQTLAEVEDSFFYVCQCAEKAGFQVDYS